MWSARCDLFACCFGRQWSIEAATAIHVLPCLTCFLGLYSASVSSIILHLLSLSSDAACSAQLTHALIMGEHGLLPGCMIMVSCSLAFNIFEPCMWADVPASKPMPIAKLCDSCRL